MTRYAITDAKRHAIAEELRRMHKTFSKGHLIGGNISEADFMFEVLSVAARRHGVEIHSGDIAADMSTLASLLDGNIETEEER